MPRTSLTNINLSAILLVSSAVYLSCQQPTPASPQSPTPKTGKANAGVNTSENGKWSPAIQELIADAQSGSSVPIRIETFHLDVSKMVAYQGQTSYGDDAINMRVGAGVSKDYDEALLAHELFHVILSNKGASTRHVGENPHYNTISRSEIGSAGTRVNSCFTDELIDRETAKRGFKPGLLTDLEAKWVLAALERRTNNAYRISEPVLQRSDAVKLFCLGLRHPSSEQRIDKLLDTVSPGTAKAERELRRKFNGVRCEFDDPKGCFALAVRLRDAAEFQDFIALKNPITSQWE
jgi:hypothetical protein